MLLTGLNPNIPYDLPSHFPPPPPQVLGWLGHCHLQNPKSSCSTYLMALTQHMAQLPVTSWGQVFLSPERLFSPVAVGRDCNLHPPSMRSSRSLVLPALSSLQSSSEGFRGWGKLGPTGFPPCLGLPVTGQSQGEGVCFLFFSDFLTARS